MRRALPRRRLAYAAALTLVTIAGCAAPPTSSTLPSAAGAPFSSNAHHGRGRLVLHIHIPKKQRTKNGRRARYVSPATQSITINLTGPSPLTTSAPLTPTSSGCSSSLAGTFCTLSISLAPGAYTGSISTWDNTAGGPPGHELSANQTLSITVMPAQANTFSITLGGIPKTVLLVPGASSSLIGNASGYTLSKCGSDTVSVYGVDADGNIILGAGAPTPSLQSDNTSSLAVSTPQPSTPNSFTIVRPSPPPLPGSTIHLTAQAMPVDGAGSSVSSAIPMTFNHDICGVITEFSTGIAAGSRPYGIAAGPDGNVWFTEFAGNNIGKITPAGTISVYPLITSGANPSGMTEGPDGNLWFAECYPGKIGKITTAGTVTEYSAGITTGANPRDVTVGSDGNLWFNEYNTNRIGKITTSGTVTEYSSGITANAIDGGITSGPDGNIWFTEQTVHQIGTITTSGAVTEFASGITSGAQPASIVAGPDGNLWFAEAVGVNPVVGKIAKITTGGAVTEYPAGSGATTPDEITSGPDGNIWFTMPFLPGIGKITTSGTITMYTAGITSGSHPMFITTGPDGNLWFTEEYGPRIGRLQ